MDHHNITVHSRRRPNTPSPVLDFADQTDRNRDKIPLETITVTDRDRSSLPSTRPPNTLQPRRSSRLLAPVSASSGTREYLPPSPTAKIYSPDSFSGLVVTIDSPSPGVMLSSRDFPPTPTPSTPSSRRNSLEKVKQNSGSVKARARMFDAAANLTKSGSSSSITGSIMPPTPPEIADDMVRFGDKPEGSATGDQPSLGFVEPSMPQRPRRGRRPPSIYPDPLDMTLDATPASSRSLAALQSRRSSDEQPSEHHTPMANLGVHLDAYSATRFLDGDEPCLSFMTTSTAESTTTTPSSIAMQYRQGSQDSGHVSAEQEGKSRGENDESRIRVRTNTGRAHAYSSAESSTASGAYSYHAYADNNIFHPHPPPLPVLPSLQTDSPSSIQDHPSPRDERTVGLGFGRTANLPQAEDQEDSPISPRRYDQRWDGLRVKTDMANRLRSDSGASTSSAVSTTSQTFDSAIAGPTQTSPIAASEDLEIRKYAFELAAIEPRTPEALALLQQGKDRILTTETVEKMGGIKTFCEESLESYGDITHVILRDCPSLSEHLPVLLAMVSRSLVVLDVTGSDLFELPEELASCHQLEELNVSNNMLRFLPTWLFELQDLRMLMADGCGLSSIPTELAGLRKLHTLCLRRNRLVSLPTWLCLLKDLDTLRVDDNPFCKEWIPIVTPILASSRMSPPPIPPRSVSRRNVAAMSASTSMTSLSSSQSATSLHSMSTTETGGLSAAQSMYQLSSLGVIAEDHPHSAPAADEIIKLAESPSKMSDEDEAPETPEKDVESPQKAVRKMRSAGDLLNARSATTEDRPIRQSSFRAPVQDIGRNLPMASASTAAFPTQTLGPRGGRNLTSAMGEYRAGGAPSPPRTSARPSTSSSATGNTKKDSGKWGFFRKMSMKSMKNDKGLVTMSAFENAALMPIPPPLVHANSDTGPTTTPLGMSSKPPLRSANTLPLRREPVLDDFGTKVASLDRKVGTVSSNRALPTSMSLFGHIGPVTTKRGKRKSFLPIDGPPTLLNVAIPSTSPFMPNSAIFEESPIDPTDALASPTSEESKVDLRSEVSIRAIENGASTTSLHRNSSFGQESTRSRRRSRGLESPAQIDSATNYSASLDTIKSYLRDLHDLSRPATETYGGLETVTSQRSSGYTSSHGHSQESSPMANFGSNEAYSPASLSGRNSISEARRIATLTTPDNAPSSRSSTNDASLEGSSSVEDMGMSAPSSGKKFKNDRAKRARILREIYETERTYVRGLGELVTIYVKQGSLPVAGKGGETVVPLSERKIVFGGVDSILNIHRDNFLPSLETAVKGLLEGKDDSDGQLSIQTAHQVGNVFRTYSAYMKQYSSYINNFENALTRMKTWTAGSTSTPNTPAFPAKSTLPTYPGKQMGRDGISNAAVSVGMGLSSLSLPLGSEGQGRTTSSTGAAGSAGTAGSMSTSQKKRVKAYLKKCREHPMHSQINLESYLLLPIQRVPRYKLLLEDLAMCTPPDLDAARDPIDDALNEISSLASLMNEEKRDAESRLRLLAWQQKITTRGPSPLVQPHRRLILDGELRLIRLVKKASTFVEIDNTSIKMGAGDGDRTITPSKIVVPVDHIAPEPMNLPIMLILCSDLLALVQQKDGMGWENQVDLFNVLRLGTSREPASVINGNVLRIVDNRSIYYFAGSDESVLQWSRAINTTRRR